MFVAAKVKVKMRVLYRASRLNIFMPDACPPIVRAHFVFFYCKVKHEGVKRSAANFVADRSDDVQVTSKPKEEVDTFSRPAKRGKGPSEEDVEMMGKKGVDLPHNRFSCTEVRLPRSSRPAVQSVNCNNH